MNKPHKHAALIHAWADGMEIEKFTHVCCEHKSTGSWKLCPEPMWIEGCQYRIKEYVISAGDNNE